MVATLRPTHERGPYEKTSATRIRVSHRPSRTEGAACDALSAFSSSRVRSSDSSHLSGLYSSASGPQNSLRRWMEYDGTERMVCARKEEHSARQVSSVGGGNDLRRPGRPRRRPRSVGEDESAGEQNARCEARRTSWVMMRGRPMPLVACRRRASWMQLIEPTPLVRKFQRTEMTEENARREVRQCLDVLVVEHARDALGPKGRVELLLELLVRVRVRDDVVHDCAV